MKLPLRVIDHPDHEGVEMTLIVDADGEALADCGILGRDVALNEAVALRFVLSVNASPDSAWIANPKLPEPHKPGGAL